MDDVFKKVSMQMLNALFVPEQDDAVLWVRSPDFLRQVYVSPEPFEKIWERDYTMTYKNNLWWPEFIVPEKHRGLTKLIQENVSRNEECNFMLYQIFLPNGEKIWIKDSCFRLYKPDGSVAAITGISQVILPETVEVMLRSRVKTALDYPLEKELQQRVEKELNLSFDQPKKVIKHWKVRCRGQVIELTRREIQCLIYLMQGYSAKMIAKHLHISFRTVELYFDHIRQKTACRNRLELCSQVDLTGVNFYELVY